MTEPANRASFCIIGIEERSVGSAVQYALQLPRQIPHIINAGIGTEAPASWGKLMGSIPSKKYAPLPVLGGDATSHFPTPSGDDVKNHVAPQCLADRKTQFIFAARVIVDEHQQPTTIVVGRQEDTEVLLFDFELLSATCEVLVCLRATEKHTANRADMPYTVARNTQALANRAVGTIGGNQVIG